MIFVCKWPHHRISIERSFSKGVAVLGSACCLMLLSQAELGRLKGPRPISLFKDGSVKGYVQREKRLVVSGIIR